VALTARTLPPERETRGIRHHQLLAVCASVLAIWASAKSVMLSEQLTNLATAVAGADADRFLAASAGFDRYAFLRSFPTMLAWLALALLLGGVAVKGDLLAKVREHTGQLAAALGFGVVVLAVDVVAFEVRLQGVDDLVPAWAEASIHAQIHASTHAGPRGVVVERADPPLLPGDVVVFAGDRAIDTARDLAEALRGRAPGLELTVVRDGARREVALP
jgi:hypothetical protein